MCGNARLKGFLSLSHSLIGSLIPDVLLISEQGNPNRMCKGKDTVKSDSCKWWVCLRVLLHSSRTGERKVNRDELILSSLESFFEICIRVFWTAHHRCSAGELWHYVLSICMLYFSLCLHWLIVLFIETHLGSAHLVRLAVRAWHIASSCPDQEPHMYTHTHDIQPSPFDKQ